MSCGLCEQVESLVAHGAASRTACGNDAGAANCSAAAVGHELAMFDFTLNNTAPPGWAGPLVSTLFAMLPIAWFWLRGR